MAAVTICSDFGAPKNKVWLCFHYEVMRVLSVLSRFSRPTLCDPIDGSPSGCPVPGILQARALEWVAISFSNAWKWKVKVKSLSHVRLFATPWTAAYQAPPSMEFSRQEYWSGLPLPSHFEKIPFGLLRWKMNTGERKGRMINWFLEWVNS